MKGASAFNNDPDCILTADVLPCCPNQVAVDRRIEIGIINNIIDMTVDVIIHPAGWDFAPSL